MSAEPYVGEIQLFGFNFTPRKYTVCAGALLPISAFTALYSLLGVHYGGDGRTTFGVPDLRGRAPVNFGHGPGLSNYPIGKRTGSEYQQLTVAQLPNFKPQATFASTGSYGVTATATDSVAELIATTEIATSATPSTGAYLATATAPSGGQDKDELMYKPTAADASKVALSGIKLAVNVDVALTPGDYKGEVNIDAIGGGQLSSMVQPILALNYCIFNDGLYPPRD